MNRSTSKPDFLLETKLSCRVAGVDEAGRAPLAGPVCAAAVILHPDRIPTGLNDSKKLSRKRRESLFDEIMDQAMAYQVAYASLEEIEALNILHASMLAMRRAVEALAVSAEHALIDGNRIPTELPCEATAIVKGDQKSCSIAAASILAKVSRDRLMTEYAEQYPHYGWERNAGYPVKAHVEAIQQHGITPLHRRGFRIVSDYIEAEERRYG